MLSSNAWYTSTFAGCHSSGCKLHILLSFSSLWWCTVMPMNLYVSETNGKTCYFQPIFHDGMKEWSCCKKRSHDFSLFLEIPGYVSFVFLQLRIRFSSVSRTLGFNFASKNELEPAFCCPQTTTSTLYVFYLLPLDSDSHFLIFEYVAT